MATQLVETRTVPCVDVPYDKEHKIKEILAAANKMRATRVGESGPEYRVLLKGLLPAWYTEGQLVFAVKARSGNIPIRGKGGCACGGLCTLLARLF